MTREARTPAPHVPPAPGGAQLFGFDSDFLHKLERLTLFSRQPISSHSSVGPRRSRHHGASVEFSDFRDYSPGDDIRRVDWNAYARLDRVFLRLYAAEQVSTLTVLLDRSASMAFGQPSKALSAARLAAILSYIALHTYDSVRIVGWGERIATQYPPRSGRKAIPEVWQSIADVMGDLGGGTESKALVTYAGRTRGSGLAVVLSDFLTDTDWRAGLLALQARGLEVSVVQILAPEEIEPRLRGAWTLQDVETGTPVEITVSPRVLRRYKDELAAHTARLQDFTRRQGMTYVQIPSDESMGDRILRILLDAHVLEP